MHFRLSKALTLLTLGHYLKFYVPIYLVLKKSVNFYFLLLGTGTFGSCKEARELVAANPPLDISSPSGYNSVLNETALIELNIEGVEFPQYCGPDEGKYN